MYLFVLDGSTSTSTKESNEANRVTMMIICNCTIYFVGNFADCLAPLVETFGVNFYNDLWWYIVGGNVLLFGSHGVTIFNYYFFNRNFRNSMRKLFLSEEAFKRTYETSTAGGTTTRGNTATNQSDSGQNRKSSSAQLA